MVFIIPLVPVVIFLFLLASGVVLELSAALPMIHRVVAVIVVIVFVLTAIHIVRNGVTSGRRTTACILAVPSCLLSLGGLRGLIDALASVESSLLMVFEFVLILFFGGLIWALLTMGALWLCMEIAGL